MSEVIQVSVRNRTKGRAGSPGADDTVGPARDLGWLLYAVIEIEIAQASLANAISRLPSSDVRDQLREDHTDLKRQMKMVRATLDELMHACESGLATLRRP